MELVWSKMKQPYGEYCIGEIIKVTATIKNLRQLEFFEKKSSCFIIVIIYIYIIYLIGLNLCPTLCLILCPIF